MECLNKHLIIFRGLFVYLLALLLALALSFADTSIVLNPNTDIIDVYGRFNMSNHKIINLATPTAASDAATKQYVDNLVSSQGGTASGWNDTGTVVKLLTGTDNVNATTLFVDNANGKVGIGTSSPSQKLTVAGNANITGSIYEGGTTLVNKYVSRSDWTTIDNYPSACAAGEYVTAIGDTLTCSTPSPSSAGGWTDSGTTVKLTTSSDNVNATTLFVDNANGKVGIGTGDPSATLDVEGSIVMSKDGGNIIAYSSSGAIELKSGAGYPKIKLSGASINFAPGNSNPYDTSLYRSAADTLKTDDALIVSDKVGIGTDSPSYKLTVEGNASINGTTFVVDAANERVGIGTASPSYKLEVSGSASVSGTIYEGGSSLASKYVSRSDWTTLDNYPSACSAGQYVTAIGDTLTCSTPSPSSAGGWTDSGTTVKLTTSSDNVNATTLFVDNANGKVGIGTTEPNKPLEVYNNAAGNNVGGILINRADVNKEANLQFGTANANRWWFQLDNDGTHKFYLYQDSAGFVQTWDTNGKVGIGTTSPTQKLDVNGSINVSSSTGKIYTPELCLNGDCQTSWPTGTVDGSGAANRVAFWTDSDTISYDGNITWDNANKRLGIGTTSPDSRIQIVGNDYEATRIKIIRQSDGTYGPHIEFFKAQANGSAANDSDRTGGIRFGFYNGTSWTIGSEIYGIVINVSKRSGALVFATKEEGTNYERVRIASSGNVGIGTTSPGYALDVVGSIRASTNLISKGNVYVDNDGTNGYIIFGGSTSDGEYIYRNGNDIKHFAGGSELLTLDGDTGKVGIGTDSPSKRLEVSNGTQSITLDPEATTPTINTTGTSDLIITSSTGNVIIQIG